MCRESFDRAADDIWALERLSLCPVCQSNKINYAFHISGRRHDECLECGLLFLNPQPDSKKLDQIYETGYLLGAQGNGGMDPGLISMKRASARLLLELLKDYLDLADLYDRKLLDVGCGAGFLLAEAESLGIHCVGIDPSKNLLDKADKIIRNSQLYRGSVLECNLEPGQFDICTLSDTIEHIPDLRDTLFEIRKLLKPKGIILIATPSLNSFSSRIMKNNWVKFKLENLFYFKENNLQRLLYETGFCSVRMSRHKKALNMDYIRSHFEKFPIAGFLGKLIQVGTELIPHFLRRTTIKLGGSGMVAIAKRTSEIGNPKKISVVMPVFNEQKTFRKSLTRLIKSPISDLGMEIVVVESNSTDGTRDEVLEFSGYKNIKIVLQESPRGKGNALREGFKHVTGDIIIIQDADLEYDVWDYPALIRPIVENRYSFVLGARHKGSGMKMRSFEHRPLLAFVINFGHIFLTTLFNILYRQNVKDPFTMYKVFRRDCIENMEFECNYFDFDIELVIRLVKRGFIPLEVPVNYASRSFSDGKKVSFRRDPFQILKTIVRLRFN